MYRSPKIPLRRPIVNSGDHHEAARWRRFRQDGHLFVRRQGRDEDGRKFLYWECGGCGARKGGLRSFGSPEELPVVFEGLEHARGTTCAQLLVRTVLDS